MKIAVTALFIIAVIQASTTSVKEEFEKFKHDYNRKYGCPEEEKVRFLIFNKTFKMIQEINAAYEAGNLTWKAGINNFADFVGIEVPLGVLPANETKGPDPKEEFDKFKKENNRTYACPELELVRFHIFEMNLQHIVEHNNEKNSTFKLKINKFSDLLTEEVPKGLNKTT